MNEWWTINVILASLLLVDWQHAISATSQWLDERPVDRVLPPVLNLQHWFAPLSRRRPGETHCPHFPCYGTALHFRLYLKSTIKDALRFGKKRWHKCILVRDYYIKRDKINLDKYNRNLCFIKSISVLFVMTVTYSSIQ